MKKFTINENELPFHVTAIALDDDGATLVLATTAGQIHLTLAVSDFESDSDGDDAPETEEEMYRQDASDIALGNAALEIVAHDLCYALIGRNKLRKEHGLEPYDA